jgi:hypothetical protein
MPKRIKQTKRARDPDRRSTVRDSLPSVTANISEYMAAIGRKGGKIGGKRRLATLTKEERKRIATAAARARWKKKSEVGD